MGGSDRRWGILHVVVVRRIPHRLAGANIGLGPASRHWPAERSGRSHSPPAFRGRWSLHVTSEGERQLGVVSVPDQLAGAPASLDSYQRLSNRAHPHAFQPSTNAGGRFVQVNRLAKGNSKVWVASPGQFRLVRKTGAEGDQPESLGHQKAVGNVQAGALVRDVTDLASEYRVELVIYDHGAQQDAAARRAAFVLGLHREWM